MRLQLMVGKGSTAVRGRSSGPASSRASVCFDQDVEHFTDGAFLVMGSRSGR
jgi:hypothetical protein